MTIVEVAFPKGGGPPIVSGDTEAVCEDHVIAWHVKSENPEVKSVKIEFPNGEPFFPKRRSNGGPKPALNVEEEDFDYGKPKVAWVAHGRKAGVYKPKEWDTQLIWGRAPILVVPDSDETPVLPEDSLPCKYNVYGYDANGAVVGKLDPNILISKP